VALGIDTLKMLADVIEACVRFGILLCVVVFLQFKACVINRLGLSREP
jgi:hypothetical protein